jgi:drug/metabolite transporter (DMT)-like permease
MTDQRPGAPTRVAPAGLLFLAITALGWGLSWPITKHILTEWPPLSARGWSGLVGGALLAGLALLRGESFAVPRSKWTPLLWSAFLNVTVWMFTMGIGLLSLPASEAVLIAYSMPVWALLLAWPILGERLSGIRILALLMGFAGIAALMSGNGIEASAARLPGMAIVLIGAIAFALGTIAAKRYPLGLPLTVSAAWQLGIGSLPVVAVGMLFEHPRIEALTPLGWALMAYMTVIGFCAAYLAWFAALARLPASIAAIGTMAVPVVGVVASAVALHETLGFGQIAALIFTLAGVALATRS